MSSIRFVDALKQALVDELTADPSVVLWGEDIARHGGNYRVTRGLLDQFGPLRVRDSPISEQAMVSLGVGAAMAGLRPVVEISFAGLLPLVAEQLINQAALTHYRTGGQWSVPLTIRTRCGGQPGNSPVSGKVNLDVFSGVPGLVVFAPGTPSSAYTLLRAAIRSEDPVVFFEHGALYATRGDVEPDDAHPYAGEAKILLRGKDVTVVALMAMVPEALRAATELRAQGIEIEVIDPRTIYPCDFATIFDSIKRTGRLVVIQDWPVFGGLSAEIVAKASELGLLRAPAIRVGFPSVPFPVAPHFGRALLPTAVSIGAAVRNVLDRAN